MQYNEKAVRRALRIAVEEAKKSMFGKTRCTDMGGRKWKVEYSILYWREAGPRWGKAGWDQYHSGDTQKEIWQTLPGALQKLQPEQFAVSVSVLCEGNPHSEAVFLLDGTRYQNTQENAAKLQTVKVAFATNTLEANDFAWMVSEIERLQSEIRERDRAFIGHVYVPNEEYAQICSERNDAIQRAIAAEKVAKDHVEVEKALVAVMGCLPVIYEKAGFVHLPTDKAIRQANDVLKKIEDKAKAAV